MLGNPTFLDDGSYLQDKAVVLKDKLKGFGGDINENHKIIGKYIHFIVDSWRNGFSERTYNFTMNNAYNHKEVILIDLGEITFSKKSIENNIEEER